MENFAETYYPKDLHTNQKQTAKTQAFSTDMLVSLIGKDNPFLSLLKQPNNIDNNTIMQTLSSVMQKPIKTEQKKTLNSDFFEEL